MSLALLYQLNLESIGVPDTTPPSVLSVTIQSSGTVAIAFSESVVIGAGGGSGLRLNAPGGQVSLTYLSGATSTVLLFTPSRVVSTTETGITCTYVQPGNGIEDVSGNDVLSFTALPVTNNSTTNSVPSDINLSNTIIYTNGGTNAVVGTLSATDSDYGETFTFSLWEGTGDTDNASFNISGASLRCNDPSVLGAGSYSVRVRVTDSANNTREEVFAISIAERLVASRYVSTTLYSRNGRIRSFNSVEMRTGESKKVIVDFNNTADREDTTVDSVSWSTEQTSYITISNQTLAGGAAQAIITASNYRHKRVKLTVTATLADTQTVKEIVYVDIR